ncbi:S8 family serine peptidase [Paenibacillus sp. BSR1-1]|uniref:S8 family serine peptidase n=1 Tax=Paenibacillus sp. BSR1-1 TaxID=3020845 RepID=UPI0025B0B139|nr:S8 family serine peptidase [Paenibacillus sp. BSR1-1]MDN3018988.1 S8 family serine peptidase [Paenibacillus sp. BSR1-1]
MSKKNHNKKRKIATYALASALVLTNFGFVSQTNAATNKPGDLEAKLKQFKQNQTRTSFKKAAAKTNARDNLKATDKVRVIVEVDGQTPVEYATQQGVLYKELSEDKKSSLVSKAESQQKSVKAKIAGKGVAIKYKQNYSTAFNGFSGEMTYGDIAKVESVSGVKAVYLSNEYKKPEMEPNLKTSHNFVQSRTTWKDAGFKGEGMVVAVIDTGVDPSHRDFKLTDSSKEGLTKSSVDKIVADKGLKGKFYTDKVPYGYNYYDQNNTILDLGPGASMHGMHVAGIVAANGDEANGGVKGVAPEAQVLAMKVFSNDPIYPSTWSDVYLAAIDDSIKLGADVLNMSLGDVAAFYQENGAEDLAIQRATANGIVCAMSAGNSNHIGDGWDDPYAQNPDIGVVGAPSLNPDGISVAASGNEAYLYQTNVTVDGLAGFTALGKGIDDWSKLSADNGGKLELVSLGADKLGSPEDYEGLDVKGKVVLVPRGTLSFFDKTKNAAAAGAAGIIVYNKTNGVWFDNQGGWDVPFMLIPGAEGATLEQQIANGPVFINVATANKQESPEMGRMTSFTSWGTTPSLELKPEITAPGGNIYSTVNNNQYEVMSGTSMASPHVAGGSALVQQYLQGDARFKDLSVADRTHLAKVLLMNTAQVIKDLNGQPFSPRREGAGMMQTYSAVTTPAYVVNKANGAPKVELKDFQSKQFSMTFTVKNISKDKSVTYNVDTSVLTDTIQNFGKDIPEYNALIAGNLEGAKVEAPKTVTVPAGKSVDFTVNVNFTNAKIPGLDAEGNKTLFDLRPNIFVEGSVNLTGSDATIPNLTVPYVGFYGHWDEPQIVDGFKDLGEVRYYDLEYGFKKYYKIPDGSDVLMDDEEYFTKPVPEKNFYALSPDGDNYHDSMNILPSFLRNAAEVQFNILDKDFNQIKRVKSESDVIKTAFDGGNGNFFNYKADRVWDGKVKGEPVKDGLYYYEIKSVIDYAGAKWQSKKIPVYVDTTKPVVAATFDSEKQAVTWKTTENGSGVESYDIYVNGEPVDSVDGKATSFSFAGLETPVPDKAVVEVMAWDYAGNVGTDTAAKGDVDLPLIIISDGSKDSTGEYVPNSPEPWGAYSTKEVPVKGFVSDDTGIKAIKVNGKDVEFSQGEDGKFYFDTTVKFDKDGLYDVTVEATDHSNKSFSIARKVFIDTTKPVINVNAPSRVDKNVDKVTLNVNLQDNFHYLSFYVNEDNEFEVPKVSPIDDIQPLNKNYSVTVPLMEGENKVTLKAKDLSGNETVKEVVINRQDAVVQKNGWKMENGFWFYYVNNVKATGWVKDGGKWYFLKKDGQMATGWVFDGGVWYYLTKSGDMKTGWLLEEGKWYYLNANGSMATGWKLINGKWYYLNKNGVMAANTTVDGYKLGKDGAWIK